VQIRRIETTRKANAEKWTKKKVGNTKKLFVVQTFSRNWKLKEDVQEKELQVDS
jgi:hypothetical protein